MGPVWGVAHLPTPPTSARSSRLRSTVVSPRILFTSGRSGNGTCSSTSSHSDRESPGMASRRRDTRTRDPTLRPAGQTASGVGSGHAHARPAPFPPRRPRPQPVAPAVLFKASPLFCRWASRLNYPVRSCQALAMSLVPVLADVPGLRFLVTVPRSRALETGTQAQPPSRGRHPGNCTLPQAPPPPPPIPGLEAPVYQESDPQPR